MTYNFRLGASAAAEFCEWFQVIMDANLTDFYGFQLLELLL